MGSDCPGERTDTNEPEIECVDKAVPTKKIKTNPFSWFHTSELPQNQRVK